MSRTTRKVRSMITREDYKAIKHMDKRTLDEYLLDIYLKGYRAGVKVMADEMKGQLGDKEAKRQE